eukprot:scaffold27377_cov61-Phaeocystis_antarctica.AAC.2
MRGCGAEAHGVRGEGAELQQLQPLVGGHQPLGGRELEQRAQQRARTLRQCTVSGAASRLERAEQPAVQQ